MGLSGVNLQFLRYPLLLLLSQLCLCTTFVKSLSIRSLDEATIDDLNKLQAAGIVSSVDLVKAYTRRTVEVNGYLHAVSEINPDAISIASSLDRERAIGHLRGPLHGIPILLKDNIATTDALNTSAGSYALLGALPKHEAVVARKLRDAGAVILGKVTMGEWAQFRSGSKTSSHGWSPLGGQTLGAYYPQQDPHGSSSGSAVAVSVGLAAGTLATETSGSIVNPAERNNVVGIKPTLGLTSRDMVIPISLRQDSVGPMAQTVKDAAYLLSAIAGKDQQDVWTLVQPWAKPPDYVKACKDSGLNRARLGVPRNGIEPFLSHSSAPIMTAFQSALETMRDAGANIEDAANFSSFNLDAFNRNSNIVLAADFESGLLDYLSKLSTNPNHIYGLTDLIRYTRNHPFEEVNERGISAWEYQARQHFTTDSFESRTAYQANLDMAGVQGILGALERHDLDALVMPTFAAFQLAAIAGLPIVTVPLGFYPANTPLGMNPKGTLINVAPGIPFGLAFVGRKWSEETLISLAHAFEQRSKVRNQRKPLIRPVSSLPTAEMERGTSHRNEPKRHTRFIRMRKHQHAVQILLGGFARQFYRLLTFDMSIG